jgi:hypothetical protein
MEQNELKQLQRELVSALALFLDLSEAACEILTQSPAAPLAPADRARLSRLRRQEVASLKSYLSARLRLMTALSVEPTPEIRSFYNALAAVDRRPQPHAQA